MILKRLTKGLILLGVLFSGPAFSQENNRKEEGRYYQISDVPIPDSIVLEVGGLAFTPDDRLGVSTRRGKIWIIDDPYSKNEARAGYSLFASGLHEPLGLAFHDGAAYVAQRGELTKITDTDEDGKGDLFNTVYAWPLSGNYHEYSYGPLFLPDGDMILTLNLAWTGKGTSLARWRGWMIKIKPDGTMIPFATGLRSPAGFGLNSAGDLFVAENQGDWIGTGRITHIEKGDFAGHPAGLRWTGEPNSPLDMKAASIPDSAGLLYDFAQDWPALKVPSVRFPHAIMGISTSAITTIPADAMGPFKDQLLVGDQGHSKIMRVALEKVNGVYQGACFPFLEGFSSGILRFAWGSDHSLFVGMTSRGWPSTGKQPYGLQRVSWKGKTPFEMKTIKATGDGFEIEFTQPVDRASADDINSYQIAGFTYVYHRAYGSPIVNQQSCPIDAIEISPDGRKAKLRVRGLRKGYIHEVKAAGVRSRTGAPLLHPTGYYTLNEIPGGGSHDHDVIASAEPTDNSRSGCGSDHTKNVTTMPADWENGPDQTIKIGTKPGLLFDVPSFQVYEGSKVQITFTNDDDMLHNLVVVKFGTYEKVGNAAMNLGLEGPKKGYIPETDDVLFHTCILQPEITQSIYFVAPKAGEYNYVCTFPGHSATMNGVMKVIKKPSNF